MPERRRRLGALLAGLSVGLCSGAGGLAAERPLVLGGLGVFYVNGEQTESPYSDRRGAAFPTTGRTTVRGQARVTYLLPAQTTAAPVVLVPGFGLSSTIYLTTPDGREGWAQILARAGHPVYAIDLPERGASGLSVDAINGCIAADPAYPCHDPAAMPGRTSLEQPWNTWGFGPRFGEAYPESRFPSLPLTANYVEQFGAAFDTFLGGGNRGPGANAELEARAVLALLNRIGTAVLVLHSAAGAPGYLLARREPAAIRALVAIETTACPANDPEGQSTLRGIPFLGLWGDYVGMRAEGGHAQRLAACRQMAAALARDGTPAQVIELPADRGIRGNSHLMMQDDNNVELANLVSAWLGEQGIR